MSRCFIYKHLREKSLDHDTRYHSHLTPRVKCWDRSCVWKWEKMTHLLQLPIPKSPQPDHVLKSNPKCLCRLPIVTIMLHNNKPETLSGLQQWIFIFTYKSIDWLGSSANPSWSGWGSLTCLWSAAGPLSDFADPSCSLSHTYGLSRDNWADSALLRLVSYPPTG